MNRLILIGNGFDLAHGLKTDYNSFIMWYLNKCYEQAEKTGSYKDELITIEKNRNSDNLGIHGIRNSFDFVNYNQQNEFSTLTQSTMKFAGWQNVYQSPFITSSISSFLAELLSKCGPSDWVDIENEFYYNLKRCYWNDGRVKFENIETLNRCLSTIINELDLYLRTLHVIHADKRYIDILSSKITKDEIVKSNLLSDSYPENTMLLNFNYTFTVKMYEERLRNLSEGLVIINNIHGEINNEDNPLIFGFGDELDDDYKKMELTKVNQFFEYIKSFWYFKTPNYHDLIRFIESNEYQVYIIGHSCGLSDRTLLNMIFEHPQCKSIKIFYHGEKKSNNFKRLTQEISRQFKDKVSMRNKIVPFDKCFPMPQLNLNK